MNNLTKLDEFANNVLVALHVNNQMMQTITEVAAKAGKEMQSFIAMYCYDIAEEMLKESEKRQPKQEKEKVVIPDMKNDIA